MRSPFDSHRPIASKSFRLHAEILATHPSLREQKTRTLLREEWGTHSLEAAVGQRRKAWGTRLFVVHEHVKNVLRGKAVWEELFLVLYDPAFSTVRLTMLSVKPT